MPKYTLVDWYGNRQTFDRDTIYAEGEDGGLVPFTHGEGNPVIEPLNVTQNGTYEVPYGVNGYSPVSVNVPVPEIKLQEKTITENGEYTADSGFDGLGKITVEVAGSGGGSLPAGVYLANSTIEPPDSNRQKRFMYKGDVYTASRKDVNDGFWQYIHKWNKATKAWEIVISDTSSSYGINNTYIDVDDFKTAEYNGVLHVFSGKYHAIFNGTTVVASTVAPTSTAYPVVYQNKLMIQCSNNKILHEWDATSATWVEVATFSGYYNYPVVVNGELYLYMSYALYKYENGSLTKVGTVSTSPTTAVVVNGKMYSINGWGTFSKVFMYDFETHTEIEIGRIPNFAQMFMSQGMDEISFVASTTDSTKSSYNYKYVFFEMHIIEATE